MTDMLFTKETQAIIYNPKPAPVQRMLDFDFLCRRTKPSIAALVQPTANELFHKAFFGKDEIIIPIYKNIKEATLKHAGADVFINFASFRSAFSSSKEALEQRSIKTVVIIAEGIPEREVRNLIAIAKKHNKWIIGPATVGGILAGGFRIGNTAGTIENIISSKLYRSGSIGFVSKSGGMSNEMYNMLAQNTDGIYEGIAIGGDKFPGSTLLDHLMRFESNPKIKMMVALGELGGEDEYEIIKAKDESKLTKPIVMWVTGTCAKIFPTEVQFGHAGAKTGKPEESADAKNAALRKAGVIVPESFEDFSKKINEVYLSLDSSHVNSPEKEKSGKEKKSDREKNTTAEYNPLPSDYEKLYKEGKVRRATNFICTISDDRGEELLYAGAPISRVIEENYSIGDVISLLWFKKKLEPFASKFIELCLIIAADHGPAVSGAHNAIVTARAGKDLVSSLCSGLLTIGPRFGGAIDDAARYFKTACDGGIKPSEFVEKMKKEGILIPGIGHRTKSKKKPDKRVELLKNYARKNFSSFLYLDYALEVEKITLSKADNLILNVDGCIAVLFLDMLSSSKNFTNEEIKEIAELGYLNGLFVLARSIGIIGHIFDQKRLKQGLYRHPWDDILFG